ncbi:b152.2 [Murid betaherpesvirus 8]|uniref:B152.2 n=1 Tax=Rat cytomegalovirus (isolate England) TaxID=1261657 RepID=A0A0E3SWW6_RCMVE|nr:b152.2 [Murid betaherpesvirus 8]WPH25048.1 b152.2 [Murid betaherpesvirus 8]WPH25182.1 b152.2 [Murid betaherpesvirus 8]
MRYIVIASYIIYVSHSYTFNIDNSTYSWLCHPLLIKMEYVNDPTKYDMYTLSLGSSFPLIEITATNRSDRVYPWLPFEQMIPELSFTMGQEKHTQNLRKALGHEDEQLIFIYVCNLTDYSYIFRIDLGYDTILINNKSKVIYVDWVNKTILSGYSRGFGVDALYIQRDKLKNRWLDICVKLASMDKPLDFAYTYTYYTLQRTVRCTMQTTVPLIYEISIKGLGLTTKYGIYTLFNDMFVFSVTTVLPQGYDISLVKCEVKSPSGWVVILTQPNDPRATITGYSKVTTKMMTSKASRKTTPKLTTLRKTTPRLTTYRKITTELTTYHKMITHNVITDPDVTISSEVLSHSGITQMSERTIFKITFGNDSNYQDTDIQSSNEAGVIISVVVLTLVICLITVIVFRKRLGIRVIDDTIQRLRERLQYAPAGRGVH